MCLVYSDLKRFGSNPLGTSINEIPSRDNGLGFFILSHLPKCNVGGGAFWRQTCFAGWFRLWKNEGVYYYPLS